MGHPMQMTYSVDLPAPADQIVAQFIEALCRIQPAVIQGIYLTGSLPLNDFYANKSDIDFLVLCSTLPDKSTVANLQQIHRQLAEQFPKPDLSGSYLTSDVFHTDQPEQVSVLSYHEGSMRYESFEMAPVRLSELKSYSLTLMGDPAHTLPFHMGVEKLNAFLYSNINTYWASWIHQHSRLLDKGMLLFVFPRFTEWVVLGLARQLYTLHTGKITSKLEAGHYLLGHIPERFHLVVKDALTIRMDNRTFPFVKSYGISPSFQRYRATLACSRYIISLFNEFYFQLSSQAESNIPYFDSSGLGVSNQNEKKEAS